MTYRRVVCAVPPLDPVPSGTPAGSTRPVAVPDLLVVTIELPLGIPLDAALRSGMLSDSALTSRAEWVALDFAADDIAEPCAHCPLDEHGVVEVAGSLVLREWHLPDCAQYLSWQ